MKKILLFVLLFCISMSFAFAQEQEECDGLLELEMRHIQLEAYVIENGLEVPVPEPQEITEEKPSCDEMTVTVTDRIEDLEEYIEENGLDVPEELSEDEQAELQSELKAKMEENAQKGDQEVKTQKINKESQETNKGNEISAEKSKGMPSCEEQVGSLQQRIADLEKYIEENDLEIPEPTEEQQELADKVKEANKEKEDDAKEGSEQKTEDSNEKDKEETAQKLEQDNAAQEQKQGFFKGIFKKFTGFFGGNKENVGEAKEEEKEPETPKEETSETV